MPETEEKTVEVMKTVACPWRKGAPMALSLCLPCEYHRTIEPVIQHRWNDALGKTEPCQDGEIVRCSYQRVIRVGHVVVGA